MRHRCQVKHFSRKSGARKALIRGLVTSLVEHERIKTTLPKAKELRRHVERAVTAARAGTVHARRTLLSKYPNEDTVQKLVGDLGKRFEGRPGGYTRIRKLGQRVGDGAPMCFIEFVDYDPAKQQEATVKVKTRDGKRKEIEKELTQTQFKDFQEKKANKRWLAKRKHLRKVSNTSRTANR